VTTGRTPDGQATTKGSKLSVGDRAIRLKARTRIYAEGDVLRYALLAYSNTDVRDRRTEDDQRRSDAGIAEILERPDVTGWLRLHDAGSATTVRHEQGRALLTDGPFVDSKDFLGGFILVEAESLDGALAVAGELAELSTAGVIEVRPVREEPLAGA
jgi:hypothetical protein